MANEYTNITLSSTYKGTVRTVTVDVTGNDKEILSNRLTPLTPPQSTGNYASGKKDTIIVNLLMIEERIDITGVLATDSTSTASEKKQYIKEIFKAGNIVNITYEGDALTGIMEKLEVDKDIGRMGSEPADGEMGYNVKFVILLGVAYGSTS